MQVMDRLAKGKRATIKMSESKLLSKKIYEQLPEVKLKKENTMKIEQAKQRIENIKAFDKKLRESSLKKQIF